MISRRLWKIMIFLTGLSILIGPLSRPVLAELSIEQERKLGDKFLKAVFRHLRLIEDPQVVSYVDKVGQQVVRHLEVHTFPYHFYVVDSDVLNAFAAPAGHVFINRGLVEIMENKGELAAILAHEIAHVQSRHIAERLARAKKLNLATLGGLLAGIFLGGSGGQALAVGSLAGSTSLELSYSRQDEEEADRKGLRYLEAAGYSGSEMVDIMKKMGQQSWQAGGHIPTYLSTHPGVRERVNYLASTLETRPAAPHGIGKSAEDSEGFRMIQAKLLGSYQDPQEAWGYFREWLRLPESRVPAWYGMGLVQRRQGKMGEAVNSFKRAISHRPDLSPLLVELGETYFEMGKLDKAVSVLESALSLEPNQAAALYTLGRCLLEQGKVEDARTYLATAARLNDRLPSIHYHLGMAYGRLNQLGEAEYNLGIYYQRQGSWQNARFHLQEALRHTESPDRREEIQKALGEIRQELHEAQQQEQQRRGSRF